MAFCSFFTIVVKFIADKKSYGEALPMTVVPLPMATLDVGSL